MKEGMNVHIKRVTTLLIILILALPICASQAAGTLAEDGVIKDGVFSNSAGITFTVPEGYKVFSQTMLEPGFLRIIIGLSDAVTLRGHITLDIHETQTDIQSIEAQQYLDELAMYPITPFDDRYQVLLLGLGIQDRDGKTVQQTMVSFIHKENSEYKGLCSSYAWCTDEHYIRVAKYSHGPKNYMNDFRILLAFTDSLINP